MISCRYCHQPKSSQTAVNRHIRYAPNCFRAYTQDLADLSTLRNPTWHEGQTTLDNQPPITVDLGVDGEGVNSDVEMGSPKDSEPINFDDNVESSSVPDVHLPRHYTVEIEEVKDENDPCKPPRYRRSYPSLVAQTLGVGKTPFEKLKEEQVALGESEWAPFASQEEWDLAQWLMKNVGQNSLDEFLKLPIVSSQCAGITNRDKRT
jgi:hypothetical protein